jgi:glutaredoxin 3
VDKEARNEMLKRNISGVPAFIIGDDVVIGLDKEKVLKLVDHRVVECSFCHKKVRVPINKTNIIAKCPNCKNKIAL